MDNPYRHRDSYEGHAYHKRLKLLEVRRNIGCLGI